MANAEHLQILEQGVETWNKWRQDYPNEIPDLEQAKLNDKDLSEINLSHAQLRKAIFCRSRLIDANLRCSDFSGANFYKAKLDNTNFSCSKASTVSGKLQAVFLALGKSLIVKAIITYLDKFSETPDQGI